MAPRDGEWLGLAALIEPPAAPLRPAFEALLKGPDWLGWALVGFAALLLALGRRGQRALMAAVVGGAALWAARRFGLAEPMQWLVAALGAALGALLPGIARAVALAGAGAAFGEWFSIQLGVSPLCVALPLAVLCFLVGFVN